MHETFKKVLFLAPTARADFSSGRVFNLVTSDAETLQVPRPWNHALTRLMPGKAHVCVRSLPRIHPCRLQSIRAS